MAPLRPTWAEVDLSAVRHNVEVTRKQIGPRIKLFAVLKANAYGCGVAKVARTAVEAGADAVAVGNPEEAIAIRETGVTAPILLFGATVPADAPSVADLGVVVTVHDFEGMHAFASLPGPVEVFLKVDCGFGRLGFGRDSWREAFALARRSAGLRVTGLYTHFSNPDNHDVTLHQVAAFRDAWRDAEAAGLTGLEIMSASSRVVLDYPDLYFTAVDPGRMLVGQMEGDWARRLTLRPVLRAVKSRVIQLREMAPEEFAGYGDRPAVGGSVGGRIRAAVIPVGFADGFPRLCPGHPVLVQGMRVPVIAGFTEHTLVDVTGAPGAVLGSEVVLLGRQGGEEIGAPELSGVLDVPLTELLVRLGNTLPRVYLD